MTKHIFVTGRRGQFPRERADLRLDRDVAGTPGSAGPDAEDGPLHQRRSRHDVALPARRGVRPRRRGRDRPRPRATTNASPTPRSTRTATTPPGRFISRSSRRSDAATTRGKTVQVIPHITDEIKSCIRKLATPEVDVVITEIGGTVGDIEGMPYYEAIRQFALDVGRQNCLFVHLTLVPYLKAAGELKTKPTQHSVHGTPQDRHPARCPDLPHRARDPGSGLREDRPVLQRRAAGA